MIAMSDQALYEDLRIAQVHALAAHKIALDVRPDCAALILATASALDALCSTVRLALPCEVCGGAGCADCRWDR